MSEYTATIKLKADRSGLTGELKIAAADVGKLNEALQQSGAAGAAGADGIRKHSTEAKNAGKETRTLTTETKSLREQFTGLKTLLAGYGVFRAAGFLKNTLAEYQDVRTMIQGLSESSREYQQTQEYLIDVSDRYSRNLNTMSESYARLMALKNANLVTMEESRQLLEGLSNAGAALKASNDQIGLVYYGLAQALSQVNVQAQELNQIVEPLPGILVHMDNAAGLAQGGFRRLVMEGKVTSEFFKNTLILALQEYEGAAERTYNNVSSISNRIASQHILLVAALEVPIDVAMIGALRLYETSITKLVDLVPSLIELTADLLTIMAMLAGVKLAAWLYGIAAASYTVNGALTMLEVRLLATMTLARAGTVAMIGLRGAMAFLGGPLGAVVLAATAIYAFSRNSSDAAYEAAALRSEIDLLSDSYDSLTVSQIDQQIALAQAEMAELSKLKEGLIQPETTPIPMMAWGMSPLPADYESLEAVEQYTEDTQSLNQQLFAVVKNLNALAQARPGALKRDLDEQTAAATALSKIQQDLLDKYLPLEKLTAEYTQNLGALNAIEATTTDEVARKERAIDALNAVYEEEVKELTGVTKSEEELAKVREKTVQDMSRLIEQYAPMQNAVAQYEMQLQLLSAAYQEGFLTLENYHTAVAALAEEQREAFQPGAVLVDQMREELRIMKLSAVDQEYANRIRGLSVEQVKLHGAAIRDLIVAQMEEQAVVDATEASQQEYQRSTENMLQNLQSSWADYFDQVLQKGKFTMKSLSESIITIMRQTMANVMAMDLGNAFRSTLTGGTGAQTGTGSTGGESVNWNSVAALLGGGVSSVLNASIAQTMAPVYEGGQLISEGAKSMNFSLKNIGTNIMAGFAGATIGTAVGEAVFGKQAQSNYGAMAGAAIGSMIPGVGTFLGALAGGALDAMFGGDGFKRSSVGFDTGRDSVKDGYYYGTQTFASGLQVNKINRRGDQEASDAITAKAAEIDAFITQMARAAGGTIDMSRASLSGTGADYGYNSGTFFGLRAGESADSEEALNELFASFSRQLIGHIEGLSEDVTNVIRNATGDADSILLQFQEALKLDQLVKSGALDVLGTDMTFGFAQQLVDAAGGIDALAGAAQLFNQNVADTAAAQQNIVSRLRTAVADQFTQLNIVLSDFTTVAQFRDYFESVKDTIDAVDVLKLVQAGNALALLIDQEAQLNEIRSASMTEQLSSAEDLLDAYKAARAQATALAGTLQNDIFKLSNTPAVDLRSRLRVGTSDEQLEVIDQLRQQILANYAEELRLKQQLHQESVAQYEEQIAAAKRIEDYIKGVMTGDLSPLSVADRLSTAQGQFNDVYQRALSGDMSAAAEAATYFDTLAKLNQQANASSADGVALFYENLAKLEQIGDLLGQTQSPGEFSEGALANVYLAELQQLQAEVLRVQNGMAAQFVDNFAQLKLLFKDLPKEIADALVAALPQALSGQLQLAANLGILSDQVRNSLGLLPQRIDLSSSGIAASIEAVTFLSEHPALMAANITSLAAAMGSMIQQMLKAGAPTQLIADTIAKNPTATGAANQYLGQNGLGSVSDYQSAYNPAYSNQDIAATVEALLASAQTEYDAVAAIYNAATAAGVGSGQLAQGSGYTQSEILALAAKYGFSSFDVGTDRVTKDQFARIHADEIIFNPVESGRLRQAVIDRAEQSGSGTGDVHRFVRAVEAQTALLAELVDQNRDLSSEQRQAFVGAAREITESVDRLTREMEDRAA